MSKGNADKIVKRAKPAVDKCDSEKNAQNGKSGRWTEEAVALLRKYRALDYTCSQIAKVLTAAGFPVTRNGVISKLNRLGLCKTRPANEQRVHITRTKALKKLRNVAERAKRENLPPPRPLALTVIEPGDRSLLLMERRNNQCPFPVGGEGAQMMVCGLPVSRGSYCTRCAQLVYQPLEVAKGRRRRYQRHVKQAA